MKKDKSCNGCRYRQTGWDGGFFGEPMTCECYHFGNTENHKNCSKFKRPFPKGFGLLVEFQKWFNCMTLEDFLGLMLFIISFSLVIIGLMLEMGF